MLRFHNLKTWNIYNVPSNFMEYSYVSSRAGCEIITRKFILELPRDACNLED